MALHLKPRHLSKLMRTSKAIRTWVDGDYYWTRVVLHLLCRRCSWMELHSAEFPEDTDVLTPLKTTENLFFLVGLDKGYFWGMETFLARVQEAIEYYSDKPEDPCYWLASFKDIGSLRDKAVKFYLKGIFMSEGEWTSDLPKLKGDEKVVPMKELAKRLTYNVWIKGRDKGWKKLMKEFVRKIEDHSMPSEFKRFFSRELSLLLWKTIAEGVEVCVSEVAMEICIF